MISALSTRGSNPLPLLLTLLLFAGIPSFAQAAQWEKEVDCESGALVIDSAEVRDSPSGRTRTIYQLVIRDPKAVDYLSRTDDGMERLVNARGELIVPVSMGRIGRGGCLFISDGISAPDSGEQIYIGGALDGRGNFMVEVFEGPGVTRAVEKLVVNWQFHDCRYTPRR